MFRKKGFLALLFCCTVAILALSSGAKARTVSVEDLHLKLPFPSGETWHTACIYDDPDPLCWTHATISKITGKTNKDRFALDFNWGSIDDDCDLPIVAAASGFAEVHLGFNGGYGNYVLIHHIGSFVTRYAHLNSVTVKDKTWIGRGQKVGLCGKSGGQPTCHLHFALYQKSSNGFIPVKPEPMDNCEGCSDYPTTGKNYTSSNKPKPAFFEVSDKNGKFVFPNIKVDIAWFPSESSCINAWYVRSNGEYVCSTNPEQLCRDAYNDLLSIDSDMYSSTDWNNMFFGNVDDVCDSNVFQCIVR